MSVAAVRSRPRASTPSWPLGRAACVAALALGTALVWPRLAPALRIAAGGDDTLVAPGVRVAGVPVGGLAADEAREALRRAVADPDRARVFFRAQGRTWALTWREAGVSADIAAAVRRSLAVARTGAWPSRAGSLAAGLLSGHDLEIGYRLDEEQARQALKAVREAAGLQKGALDEEASLAALRAALARGGTLVVPLALRSSRGDPAGGAERDPAGVVVGGATVDTAHLTPRQRANLAAGCAQLEGCVVAPGTAFVLADGLRDLSPERGFVLAEPLPPCPAAVCLGAGVEVLRDALAAAWRDANLPVSEVAEAAVAGTPYDPLQAVPRLVNDTEAAVTVRVSPGSRRLFVKLYGGPNAGSLAVETEPAEAPSGANRLLTVAAVGDVQLWGAAQAELQARGPAALLADVASELAGADLALGNLECVVSPHTAPGSLKRPEDVAARREWLFRVPPNLATPFLKAAGIDYYSLANNHSLDYGVPGLADTGRELDRLGISFGGAGGNISEATQSASHEVAAPPAGASSARDDSRSARTPPPEPEARPGGTSVAVLSYAARECVPDPRGFAATRYQPGVALVGTSPDGMPTAATAHRLQADLRGAADTHDVVICLFHWGVEGDHLVTAGQRALAHLAVDSGADLVLGHHPHVLQTLECYRGKLIAYSLGNFVFSPPKPEQRETGILRVRFSEGALSGADFLPATIVGCAPRRLAPEQEALRSQIADRLLTTPLPEG